MKIKSKKSLGQNFLIDQNILKKIVEIDILKNKPEIIEIGPGTGNLTEFLVKSNPKKIYAIEKDENLAKDLSKRFADRVDVINEDILKFSDNKIFTDMSIIIGNLPYNISSQILVKFILNNCSLRFKALIFMFQKEVANRILAKVNSKEYGRLSILANWKFNIKKVLDVKPNSFSPRPKVDSSLLIFKKKHKEYNLKNPKILEKVTRIFFNQRRKKIKKPIKQIFKNNIKIIEKLNLNLDLRPQNLDIKTFCEIASACDDKLFN